MNQGHWREHSLPMRGSQYPGFLTLSLHYPQTNFIFRRSSKFQCYVLKTLLLIYIKLLNTFENSHHCSEITKTPNNCVVTLV